MKLFSAKMVFMDILTFVYFASLLSMGIFTNIQTLYENKTNNISNFSISSDTSDLDSVSQPYTIVIIVNLFLICTLSKYKQLYHCDLFDDTILL